jgi:hypothetical protein
MLSNANSCSVKLLKIHQPSKDFGKIGGTLEEHWGNIGRTLEEHWKNIRAYWV